MPIILVAPNLAVPEISSVEIARPKSPLGAHENDDV
jgi:hypothetical protein